MAYRVGIVGAGNISDTHARAALEIPGVEVAAVFGRNVERAKDLADRHGGTAYDDFESFVAHSPLDLVMIGSPSGVHAEQASAFARRGVHVLVEKPLDITTARIDDLNRVAEEAGVKVGVFFQDRTSVHLTWLKGLLERGELGEVFLASARVKWYRPPEYYGGSRWRGTWALDGGGALMNQGIHTVDLLLWLLGDVERVYARTRTALHDIEVEDTVAACLEFSGGAIATLEAATSVYPGFPRRLELTGTKGTVVVEHDRVVLAELLSPPSEPVPGADGNQNASSTSATVSDVRGHRMIIEDFLRSLEGGGRPLCDGQEGRRSVALVEAIYRSARTGAPEAPGA